MATVLFDGVCNLCNAAVNFVIDRDPRAAFQFASLQSDAARALIAGRAVSDSIVLIEGDALSQKSTAALRITKQLRWPWPLFYAFIVVPRPLRDVVYDFIARHRYAWFGKQDACRLPSPELKARFLT